MTPLSCAGTRTVHATPDAGDSTGRRGDDVVLGVGIRAVYVQASETSTAAVHPVKELAAITAKRPGVILAVDGITGVGVYDLPMDAWGIDILVTGSQKALMLPPGLAFIAWSEKAEGFLAAWGLPRFYFDLKAERKKQAENQTAWTPAVSLVVGLREVLARLRAEGLAGVFARTARQVEATRAAAKALGLELYAPESPSNACTAIKLPEGIKAVRHGKLDPVIEMVLDPDISGFAMLDKGETEIVEFMIKPQSKLIGSRVSKIKLPKKSIIISLIRATNLKEVPYPESVIAPGDKVIIMTDKMDIDEVEKIFYK